MTDEQVGQTGTDSDPSAARPYPCGSSTGPCAWPECDSGTGCQFGDGSFTAIPPDAEPGSGGSSQDSRTGFEEPKPMTPDPTPTVE